MIYEVQFYINCQCVQTFHALNPIQKIMDGLDIDIAKKENYQIKPILKRLVDMCEEDLAKVINARYGEGIRINISDLKKLEDGRMYYKYRHTGFKAQGIARFDINNLSPAQVSMLIQLRYDCFGLIDSGDALDEKEYNLSQQTKTV